LIKHPRRTHRECGGGEKGLELSVSALAECREEQLTGWGGKKGTRKRQDDSREGNEGNTTKLLKELRKKLTDSGGKERGGGGNGFPD